MKVCVFVQLHVFINNVSLLILRVDKQSDLSSLEGKNNKNKKKDFFWN